MQKNLLIASNLNALVLSVPEPAEKKQGPLTGKRIVMIIAENLFHDSEFNELRIIIENAGAEVIVASSTLSEATGTFGLRVQPDIFISEILVKNFDAVIFIGGAGCLQYSSDRQAHLIAKLVLKHGKILAAIDLASCILTDAGLLKGKKTSGFSPHNVTTNDVMVTGNEVKRYRNIIIANGPGAEAKFGEAIVSALSE